MGSTAVNVGVGDGSRVVIDDDDNDDNDCVKRGFDVEEDDFIDGEGEDDENVDEDGVENLEDDADEGNEYGQGPTGVSVEPSEDDEGRTDESLTGRPVG